MRRDEKGTEDAGEQLTNSGPGRKTRRKEAVGESTGTKSIGGENVERKRGISPKNWLGKERETGARGDGRGEKNPGTKSRSP